MRPDSLRSSVTTPVLVLSLIFVVMILPGIPDGFFSVPRASADTSQTRNREEFDSAAARNEVKASPALAESYGTLPLSFEVNRGQAPPEVKFIARGQGYGLFLTSTGVVLRLTPPAKPGGPEEASANDRAPQSSSAKVANVTMRFKGSDSAGSPVGLDQLPGKSNYFIGNSASKWHTNVPLYAKVLHQNIYPGIDVVYYGNQRQLEYDLVVAPGVSPQRIEMVYEGTQRIAVDSTGDLVLSTGAGDIRQRRPIAYQDVNGVRSKVRIGYSIRGHEVRYKVGIYNKNLPLIIDPVLIYSSFLGGTGPEQGLGIAVDSQGSAYLTGTTTSIDFPLASPFQGAKNAASDAFIVKLNPAGTALVYATYLGGNGSDTSNAIAVDSQGSAYVTGLTGSGSFPTTPGALQDSKDGGLDCFVTKLNPSGSALEYSTFIGGDNSETAFGIAVDATNRAYVVGRTDSTRFRTIPLPTSRHGNPLYKSSDSGAHWSASASGLTASQVNCLTQDATVATTIYAGTSIGVFKSLDAGANWSLTGSGPPVNAPLFTNAVVVDPSNSNTIYAASNDGVYKSTNGGASYTQKNSGLNIPIVLALAIDPNAPAILYAGTLLGVFKSSNGGDSWVGMNTGTNSSRVNKIVIDPTQNPATTIYAGMSSRGVLKTTNGGGLWTPVNTGISDFAQINALAIDPSNPSILYVSAFPFADVLFKTTNGGGSWSPSGNGLTFMVGGQAVFPTVNTIAVDPGSSATVYATSNGGVFKSVDGGANWNQNNNGFINLAATAIAIDRSNTANLYSGTNIGSDAFALRLNSTGGLEYLVTVGGDETDEARGVAVDAAGNAYIVGTTGSNNLPVVNALQPNSGGFSDAFVAKLDPSGSAFAYLTYLGGSNSDLGRGIAVNGGNAYVIGTTFSSNFPVVNALKGALLDFDTDAFITKFSAAGNTLDYSTYFGGQSTDQGFAIAVDSSGSVYVTGSTASSDFPILSAPQPLMSNPFDAFVSKLNPAGNAIAYSTYLGGTNQDQGNGIAVDTSGNAYVTGNTASTDFPTANPLQVNRGATDAFVAKLSGAPDIVVSLTGSPNSLPFHSNLTYTIVVSNNGEIAADNVKLASTLLSGTGVISINTTRGSCSGNRVINCDFATMQPGEAATVTLVVQPPAVATMVNTAVATTTTPEVGTANNTATLNTPVLFTDLMLKNSSALQLTEIGGVNNYIISVTNRGPAAASSITVTDNLPPETTFVACTATDAAVCGGTDNNRTITISSLAAGASFTATIATRVNNTVAPGTVLSNTASLTSVIPDINPNNDAQTATTTAKVASGPVLNGLIAFSSRDGSTSSGGDDVWLTNPDGSGQKNLSFEESLQDLRPVWSPDGLRIAFQGSPLGIFVMNADGSNKTQLTNGGSDTSPTWSPDGTRIAFSGSRGPGSAGIYIMNSDGTNLKRLVDGGPPVWSPDGTRIAFSNGFGIAIIYADGSGRRNISLPRLAFSSFGWSPDSSKLVISLADPGSTLSGSIFTVNADGSGLTQIDNTSGGQTPCWSPDGTKIAFSLIQGPPGDQGIFTINLDGTGLLRVNGDVIGGFDPNWQRQPPNFTPLPPTFTISGRLTNSASGDPLGGSINVTGSLTRTFDVNFQNGNYIVKGLPLGGNFTLTPSLFGQATSNPANRQFDNLSSNQTGADFSITFAPRPAVNGFVKGPTGLPLPNARVGVRNSVNNRDTFTDSNGFFDFGNGFLGAQPFIIVFSEGNYTNFIFEPATRFIQDGVSNDFIGRPKTASISGTVTVGGVGRADVLLSTGNPQFLSTTTDANGNYTFNSIGEGATLTVQVDTRVFPFTPTTQTVTANGQVTGVNFAAPLNQFLITGQVTSPGSSSIEGVTMTLGGAASGTTQTDNRGNFSFGPLAANAAYTVAATKTGYSFVPPQATVQTLSSNTQLSFTGFANTVQFFVDSSSFSGAKVSANETDEKVSLTVVRSGLLSETLKVDYTTNDGTAAQRTDFTATLGTLTFGPQEFSKTIVVPLNDDSFVEGDETFTVTLSNPIGASIGDNGSMVVTLLDDDTATPTVNPLDSAAFYARQHYHDFLNRVPDSSGLTFWSEQITDCGFDTACSDLRRINVSAAFFLSIEFQETGFLVERLYKTAYGDAVGVSNFGITHQLPVPIIRFKEFLPDTQQIGKNLIVGQAGWEQQLENNKAAFVADFVSRSRFVAAYPTTLTPDQFVDNLFTNTGVTPSVSDRNLAISEFAGAGNTTDAAARARALRRVAENTTFKQLETNRAFVLMQYFGYMRRNPDDPQDTDYSGYEFWLSKLNQFNGNFVRAEMVKAFIVSAEYRHRFGP